MADFNDLLKKDKIVLVEFYASWCPHCQRMIPIVNDMKRLLAKDAPVYQFDIDENNKLAETYKVELVPTFIIFNEGTEAWRATGEIDGKMLYNRVMKEKSL